MPYSINLEVKGLDKLLAKLDDISKNLVSELDGAVEDGAQLIHDTEITIVPVKTGNLKSTIEVLPKEKPLERIVRAGGPKAPYVIWVEFGNRFMAARSFVRQSVEWRRNEIVALIKSAIAKLFGK